MNEGIIIYKADGDMNGMFIRFQQCHDDTSDLVCNYAVDYRGRTYTHTHHKHNFNNCLWLRAR